MKTSDSKSVEGSEKDQAGAILVVEDNDDFRGALSKALERRGHRVIQAGTAKDATHIVGLENVALVLSDIRMPGMSGIELLHHVKRSFKIPVVLMTGFSELAETQEAVSLGADGFLAKPFQIDDLAGVIQSCMGPAPASEPDLDHEFARLGIDDFISGSQIRYDIFIRITSCKYVKIAHAGEEISLDRIHAYKSKKVEFLFMRKTDFRSYVGFNLQLVRAVGSSQKKGAHAIGGAKRVHLLKSAGELIVQNLHVNGVDAESFGYAKGFVEASLQVATEDEDVFALLNALSAQNDWIYAHSLGVSMYAVMIARKIGWTGGANYFKISLGGMLHEIGMKEISKEILQRRRIELTSDEVRMLETHPVRGFELLNLVPTIPSEVAQIVGQHHEDCIGSGYPNGMTRDAIHPLARLVTVADEFCDLAIANPNSPGMDGKAAVERLVGLKAERLDPLFLTALMGLFGVQVPAHLADTQAWTQRQNASARRTARRAG